MSDDNVARFDLVARGGMARRGAPDKRGGSLPAETVEVECPECDAVLCLEAAVLALNPEVLCAGCDATIPLAAASR
ncbi:MAG TPA: hypothetical protein VFW15_15045 [Thermoanaerobaculia bacterium]|nr:hypothetical protein [Thermoanaerobaculia bacterium]